MSEVKDKVEALRKKGIDQSLALAMAADAQRREKEEREKKAAASRALIQRARELANLPQLENPNV